MAQLAQVVVSLENERQRLQGKLAQVTNALAALNGLGAQVPTHPKRRTMSASARKRIATAQKARWAKWKKAKKK
jgi:hypothetical protein